MMLLSSSRSTFSTAFLLALLLSTQWVDARRFAVKSASGSAVEAEPKEGGIWKFGPMMLSINMGEGADITPLVSSLEEKVGPCTEYPATNGPEAIKKCLAFLKENKCTNGKLDCINGNCTCCCA